MKQDLTTGTITKTLLLFALPMTLGNLLQQFYNIADTLIVGQFLGSNALAAVGSAYTLMTFLTSIILGLCMGSGVVVSICFGKGDQEGLRSSLFISFVMIGGTTLVLNVLSFLGIDWILRFLQVPDEIYTIMRSYLRIIFAGITASFLYNYFSSLLRAVGNSVVPLVFLGTSAVLNVGLDLLFVIVFHWGVEGAAAATVIAQFVSGLGISMYTLVCFPEFRLGRKDMVWKKTVAGDIFQLSFLTCIQQSIMNFGILLVQGRVNSFGPVVMAAFAAAVKIDSFAYMPVQDFGNAFSTFIAQNYGAGKLDRIRKGIGSAFRTSILFSITISAVVWMLARPLMLIFVNARETEILSVGVRYLRMEGAFYCLIGILFLLYGFYRAVEKPGMSVVLTVISLGLRVVLAYTLSGIPDIGVTGIWLSIPIGWFCADLTGCIPLMRKYGGRKQ